MTDFSSVTNDVILAELFKHMKPDERAIMCSVRGDPSTAEPTAWGGTPWALGNRCVLHPDKNNYVAISSFKASIEDSRFRRRKDQFGATHAIMVDDIGTKLSINAIPEHLIPSLVVETSPGNYQATFFLDTPQHDQRLAEDAIKQMITQLTGGGVDPGMAGVTRVMRLPGGINGKPKYIRDDKVWRCRVVVWRPDSRVTWLELRQAFSITEHARTFVNPNDAVTVERMRGFGLVKQGLSYLGVIKRNSPRWLEIRCPWIADHTDRSNTGAAVAPPMLANGFYGGFKCHHGHCESRTWGDLEHWVAQQVWLDARRTRGEFEQSEEIK